MSVTDHQAQLQAALDSIAGEPVTCVLRERHDGLWRWQVFYREATHLEGVGSCSLFGVSASPDEAIAAACRTLRAALGAPEPVVVEMCRMVRLAHSDLTDAMTRLGPEGDGARNSVILQRILDDLHDASLYLQSADAVAVLYASDGIAQRDPKPGNGGAP